MRSVALFVLLASVGCGSESGLVVAVSGPAVSELEFQVGVAAPDGNATPGDPQGAPGHSLFILDQSASGTRIEVSGRDLRAAPYELLLHDGAAAPSTVRVLVLGYRAGKLGAFGVTEPPQRFQPGELLRRGVALRELSGDATARPVAGCFEAVIGGKVYRVVARNDHDCDGFSPDDSPQDCDDEDQAVHPGAKEICDGKDNNCDHAFAPASQTCFANVDGKCREGQRPCDDAGGKGLGKCAATAQGGERPSQYCELYAVCGDLDPLACLSERLTAVDCTVPGPTCTATVELVPPVPAQSCGWSVTSPGDWTATLSDAQACQPTLTLKPAKKPPAQGVTLAFTPDQGQPVSVKLKISVGQDASCSASVSCYKTK